MRLRFRSAYFHWTIRYAAAIALSALALDIRLLASPHQASPSMLFLVAVILSARFCGFGPALACTLTSALAMNQFVFDKPLWVTRSEPEILRLLGFLLASVLVSSIARQKSRAELQVDETRRRLAAIVESSEDAIFSTTAEGQVTSWNKAAEVLYGYAAEEMLGKPISLIAPPERLDEVLQNQKRLNAGERIEPYETQRRRKDGTLIPLSLSIFPLRNKAGDIVGSSAIARDITARLKSEAALRRSERLATAGRLAASIAHEINNPLEAVTNLIYLARNDPQKSAQYLQMADAELDRIAKIARQTLGFVRPSAPAGPFDLNATLEEVLALLARRLESKHIEVRKRYRNPATVHGDAGEIRQLLANLIGNAIDALPVGGRLELRTLPMHDRISGIHGVRVTVADSGSGISSEHRSRIFEPFFTTKRDAGTGLGLWLANEIVQKHGGRLRVRSRTAGSPTGTIFQAFLPAGPSEVPAVPDSSPTAASIP
jgi:PAS domain S-box-containing protein